MMFSCAICPRLLWFPVPLTTRRAEWEPRVWREQGAALGLGRCGRAQGSGACPVGAPSGRNAAAGTSLLQNKCSQDRNVLDFTQIM